MRDILLLRYRLPFPGKKDQPFIHYLNHIPISFQLTLLILEQPHAIYFAKEIRKNGAKNYNREVICIALT